MSRYLMKVCLEGRAILGGELVDYRTTKFFDETSLDPILHYVIMMNKCSEETLFDFYIHDWTTKEETLKLELCIYLNKTLEVIRFDTSPVTRSEITFNKPSLRRTLNPLFYFIMNENKDVEKEKIS